MRITVTQADGVSTVLLRGELRLATVADAKAGILAALAADDDLMLDLTTLGDCDTAGVQLLLMVQASCRAKGKRCAIISPTEAFRTMLDRIGIPAEGFEFAAGVPGTGRTETPGSTALPPATAVAAG